MKEQAGQLVYALYANNARSPLRPPVLLGGPLSSAPAALPPNTWSHLAHDLGRHPTQRLWLNGASVWGSSRAGGTSSGALRFGGNNMWAEWFSGPVDELRVTTALFRRPSSRAT